MPINEAQAQATATAYRGDGRYPSGLHDGAETGTAASGQTKAEVPLTIETVITRENLMLAYQRVVENKGAAGVDRQSHESGNKDSMVQKDGLNIAVGTAGAVPALT